MQLYFPVWSIYFKELCNYFSLMWCLCYSVVSYSSLTLSVFFIVRESLWKSLPNMFRIFTFYHLLNVGFVSLTTFWFLKLLWYYWCGSFASLSLKCLPLNVLLKSKQISLFHLFCLALLYPLQHFAASDNTLKICQLLLNSPSSLQHPSFSVQCIILSF